MSFLLWVFIYLLLMLILIALQIFLTCLRVFISRTVLCEEGEGKLSHPHPAVPLLPVFSWRALFHGGGGAASRLRCQLESQHSDWDQNYICLGAGARPAGGPPRSSGDVPSLYRCSTCVLLPVDTFIHNNNTLYLERRLFKALKVADNVHKTPNKTN